jgi:hypothetical protein
MIELTPDQRRALERMDIPRVVDPDTRKTYVLVREEIYEQVKSLFGEEFQPSETYPAIDRAFAADWDDPKMDDYDRYEELRP